MTAVYSHEIIDDSWRTAGAKNALGPGRYTHLNKADTPKHTYTSGRYSAENHRLRQATVTRVYRFFYNSCQTFSIRQTYPQTHSCICYLC